MYNAEDRSRRLISVEDITIQIGSRQAFPHTSFSIEKGEHWGIFGESGSGKSLLVQALTRKINLVHGQIYYFFDPQPRSFIYPAEILTLSAESHRSFLRQYAGYHQARWQSFEGDEAPTVAALLDMDNPDLLVGLKRDYAIELFRLTPLLNRKVIHLSFGESRKVFIAKLLLKSPRLLILDDPYDGLDQESRAVFAQALTQLLRDARQQVILVGSLPSEIPQEIDRLILLKDCHLAALGPRMTVFSQMTHQPSAAPAPGLKSFELSEAFLECIQEYALQLTQESGKIDQDYIEMDQVAVTYDTTQVLKNISWSVKRGERWALLGHNGAGKSTLLSLILADNPQSYRNHIHLFGKARGSGESIWEIKQKFGWISSELQIFYQDDDSALNVVCSGYFDSIGLSRRPTGQQAAKARKWLSAFGISGLAEKPFNSLSAGQQRLILLARAMVKHPPVLVLDEPYQALDDWHRAYFSELLAQLCAHSQLTLIYVTHYQDQLPSFISHIMQLSHGEIIRQGPR